MTDVKVALTKRFEAAMKEVRAADLETEKYIAAPIADLIPAVPDAMAIRGPSWSTIARGAALPGPAQSPSSTEAMMVPAERRPPGPEPAGPPPLAGNDVVDYAGMKGSVESVDTGPPVRYRVRFPNGASVVLTDRDLGRV